MKKSRNCLIAMCLSVSLTGCTSYRSIDLANPKLKVGHTYKFYIDGHVTKGHVQTIDAEKIVVETNHFEKKEIPTSSINRIDKRKFSTFKTGALVFVTGSLVAMSIFLSRTASGIAEGTSPP